MVASSVLLTAPLFGMVPVVTVPSARTYTFPVSTSPAAAVVLETTLDAETLLDNTQRIELQQGRVRKAERWGPRTLDLDIMLFGHEVINTERLTVPHYDMKNRGFMLWPLFEVAPDLTFPDGASLHAVLHNLNAVKPARW